MKANKLLVLALASIILAVTTIGLAYAYDYSGMSQSYYRNPSDYNAIQNSYGDTTISRGGTLQWALLMQNYKATSIGGMIGSSGIEVSDPYNWNGLEPDSSGVMVPANGIPYFEMHDVEVGQETGDFWIQHYQSYFDGGYSYNVMFGHYSDPDDTMFFTAT